MAARVLTLPDLSKLSLFAAEKLQTLLKDRLPGAPFSLALSGGSTPKALYSMLSEQRFRSTIPWNAIHFFWSDERCVPPEYPESNFRMARHMLLSKVPVNQQNIHRMRGEDPNPANAALEYEKELRQFFGLSADQIPRFNLILLGLGEDGHTASLFPFSKALKVEDRLVTENYVETLRQHRLTFTAKLINAAACVIMLVSGRSKARALKDVIEGKYEPERLPAQLIQPVNGEFLYLADSDATSALSGRR
jgi:6-phosphogluconolactonase